MKRSRPVALIKTVLAGLAMWGLAAASACSSGSLEGDPSSTDGSEDVQAHTDSLTKGTSGAVNGQSDYCSDPNNKCVAGEGNCAASTECATGFACAKKYGPRYGFTSAVNVCMSSHCADNVLNSGETGIDCGGGGCGPCYPVCTGTAGGSTFCSQPGVCLCGAKQGHCSGNGECEPGLTCTAGKGPQFGFTIKTNVCLKSHCGNSVKDADETDIDCGGADCGTCIPACTGTPGTETFCDSCICSAGQGDCDSAYQCKTGLTCVSNLGRQFGYGSGVDVCVAPHCGNGVKDSTETGVDCGGADCGTCPSTTCTGTVGSATFCSTCICTSGQGNCGSSGECATGLVCVNKSGLKFGYSTAINVCQPAHCANNLKDSDETDVDCGGSCGNCPVTSVEAGANHVCEIAFGAVKCWGENAEGQLGNGTTTVSGHAIQVTGLTSGYKLVAAGNGHSCAVATAGNAVKCWGRNTEGQLGNGGTTASLTPVTVGGSLSGITQIAAGGNTTCVVSGGIIKCWGSNSAGQIGTGTIGGNVTTPTQVPGITTAVHVAVGQSHVCAALTDGTVKCWGDNSKRQIGDGTQTGTGTPTTATGVTGAVQVSAGDLSSCALTSSGTVYCWGDNRENQLAIGATLSGGTPTLVSGVSGATAITSGGMTTCVSFSGGSAMCWGFNLSGQVGANTTERVYTVPTAVSGATLLNTITGGSDFVCGRSTANLVQCWGNDNHRALGKDTTVRLTPWAVSAPPGGVTQVSAGDISTCILASGGVYCWGANDGGQIGDGTVFQRRSPTVVSGLSSGVFSMVDGGGHACAILTNGTVKCWGSNVYGELGNGSLVSSATPVNVTSLTGASAIGAGNSHTCVLRSNNTVVCWGRNNYGQLGDGTNTDHTTATLVPGMTGVIGLSVGPLSTCALLTGGTVRCWGNNTSGQLGNGNTTNSSTPVAVAGLSGTVTQVATGFNHACALISGKVYCWGDNTAGELGNGTAVTNSLTPVQVTGITTAAAISAWGSHTCARLSTGALQCWGQNFRGQLGNGLITNSSLPVTVSGTFGIFSAGGRHTCGKDTKNVLRCWGYNDYGQVGDAQSLYYPLAAYSK